MLDLCRRSAPRETGGLLVGHYSIWGDRAVVVAAIGPPADSGQFRNLFLRGVVGLSKMLGKIWKTGAYYLGEWHFHPFGSPDPSGTDRTQIRAFARNAELHCPRPIMAVVGGDPRGYWNLAVAVVIDDEIVLLEGIE